MGIQHLDGQMLKNMIIAGANRLAENKDYIDSLNVFPVPDGDTGTNMSLTALAAAREAEKIDGGVFAVAKAASTGALRGARGNSGVILSQLYRGFAKGLEGCEVASVEDIANAFAQASETAYKAVMKPREGTILTVARELAVQAMLSSFDKEDFSDFSLEVLAHGGEILQKTKEMLPVLKQADVVDAGGEGLMDLLYAAFECLGSDKKLTLLSGVKQVKKIDFSVLASVSHQEINFGYCTEFFINLTQANEKIEDEMKNFLSNLGDSIVVVVDDDIVKVHVHTDNPGLILEKAMTYGSLSNLDIDNLREQHSNATGSTHKHSNEASNASFKIAVEVSGINAIEKIAEEKKDVGFVAISVGEGFKSVFESLGVDEVIEGGQTMNPSSEDIAAACERVNADTVIVLPNNSNIILAAEQAKFICDTKEIFVSPSKSMPQGISAMIAYSLVESIEENLANMEEAISLVKTGQITYAVRNTVVDDKKITEGDYLFMIDGKIEIVETEIFNGATQLLDKMVDEGTELLTIFYGKEVSKEDAEELGQFAAEKYPQLDIELQYGAQPIYYYIFSVE